jgi:hypothetical protein
LPSLSTATLFGWTKLVPLPVPDPDTTTRSPLTGSVRKMAADDPSTTKR